MERAYCERMVCAHGPNECPHAGSRSRPLHLWAVVCIAIQRVETLAIVASPGLYRRLPGTRTMAGAVPAFSGSPCGSPCSPARLGLLRPLRGPCHAGLHIIWGRDSTDSDAVLTRSRQLPLSAERVSLLPAASSLLHTPFMLPFSSLPIHSIPTTHSHSR